jgi:hypothetical protein
MKEKNSPLISNIISQLANPQPLRPRDAIIFLIVERNPHASLLGSRDYASTALCFEVFDFSLLCAAGWLLADENDVSCSDAYDSSHQPQTRVVKISTGARS